jgi:hypothetical protein
VAIPQPPSSFLVDGVTRVLVHNPAPIRCGSRTSGSRSPIGRSG